MSKPLLLSLVIIWGWLGYNHFFTKNIPIKTETPAVITPQITYTPDYFDSDYLFRLVNDWRAENNYQPYILSKSACEIAEKRLSEIKTDWSHSGFKASKFCAGECYLGENLSRGFEYLGQEPQVLSAWLDSPSHKENLERSYTHSCIRCDSGYCVQIFSYYN